MKFCCQADDILVVEQMTFWLSSRWDFSKMCRAVKIRADGFRAVHPDSIQIPTRLRSNFYFNILFLLPELHFLIKINSLLSAFVRHSKFSLLSWTIIDYPWHFSTIKTFHIGNLLFKASIKLRKFAQIWTGSHLSWLSIF